MLGFLFWKNGFLRKHGIGPAYSLGFAMGKMATGLVYTWIMVRFIPSAKADIDMFFGGGLEMFEVFRQNPKGFPSYIADIFNITDFNIGHTDSDFIRTVFDGIKFIHFLLNFLSGGHLFTNVLLFNGLAAWLLLRCWIYLKKLTGSWWLGAWLFLFPSSFFFTSVILKEGIEYCLMAAIIPLLMVSREKFTLKRLFALLVLFLLLFFFKYLIAATFCGGLVLYQFFKKWPGYRLAIALGAGTLFVFIFFSADKIHPALDLPQYIIERRVEFQKLEANTELTMRTLEPTGESFLATLPEAVVNVFLRPMPGEVEKVFYYGFMAELYGLWLVLLFLGVKAKGKPSGNPGPVGWSLFVFGLINLLIIGYTITNTGAIIRYRSIFLPGIGYFFWVLWQGKALFQGVLKSVSALRPV